MSAQTAKKQNPITLYTGFGEKKAFIPLILHFGGIAA
jgi:hypothetical protein